MLTKIKDFWYVQINKITHLGYDAATEMFTYTLEGHEYNYQCGKEEGLNLILKIEEYINECEEWKKINMEAYQISKSPHQKIDEMKAKLMAHRD